MTKLPKSFIRNADGKWLITCNGLNYFPIGISSSPYKGGENNNNI
ncbi:MAG TPA: hypothetical protein VI278_15645 [Nitrososphaeraceae archaeon]